MYPIQSNIIDIEASFGVNTAATVRPIGTSSLLYCMTRRLEINFFFPTCAGGKVIKISTCLIPNSVAQNVNQIIS